jgi:pimeloyl-ACP methyl ester carboxylesterase
MDVGASFQFMVDAFQAERHIVALDWRGFGGSEAPPTDSYWFPDYLGDLDAVLDTLFPDQPVDLLGHSMGGNVVMSYAGVRPQRIRKLVNLEGFGLPDAPAEKAPAHLARWLDELKTPQSLRDYADAGEVAARLVKNNPKLDAARARWLAPHWAQPDASGRWQVLGDPAHKRLNAVPYRREEALACWRAITAPVLWVEGAQTDVGKWWGNRYPRSDFEARLGVVARLERRVLDDCGHMLHFDQPQALARVIEDFLAR